MLRARLERWIPNGFGALAGLAESFRTPVKNTIADADARRRFWERVLGGTIAQLALSGRMDEAKASLQSALAAETSQNATQVPGLVSLVGAGPGDPDLLTLKAFRILQEADVIVYDRLVSDEILKLARTDAERIHVGKSQSFHTLPQDEINHLLVKKAQEGLHVVRLKGGDPFIFGRGGEEIETLVEAGLSFQVVPGITAATGCAAYAGIPLTHRDFAQGVTFVTGHTKDGCIQGINWTQLVESGHTLVIYMGLQALPLIRDALMAAGAPGSRPSAMVEKGTTPEQRVVTGTLETLHEKAVAAGITSPALIIIGDVVQLEAKLGWFRPESL
jgi:uroporphyrin-III C-methyltransferase/precorrin-2 dehydrogenase/sirohydrochlorin ferrochelatase